MQLRAKEGIAERGRRNEVDQRIGIVAGNRRTRGRGGDAALMQLVGDVTDDLPGSLCPTAGIDRGEPDQPLGQPVAEGVEHPVELLLNGIFARTHCGEQLFPQLVNGLSGQRADEPLATAEMVQDQRMRNTRRGGDVLQPEPLGSGARDQRLRSFQDQPASLFSRAAQPLDPARRCRRCEMPIDIIVSISHNFIPSSPTGGKPMSQLAKPRLHPIVALRAVRKLMRNREDTQQVFLLIEALRGKTTLRQLARFRQTETGRAVLSESRRLLDRLNDRASLAALPIGSLGRAYYDFMAAVNLSAEGLVDTSKIDRPPAPDDVTLFRERNREMHDLLHVVTGYGRDPLGEACLVAFSYAQTRLKGFAVIAIFAARRIARSRPVYPVRRAVFEGYRHGRTAGWLPGADWEALLVQPVEAVRAQFAVKPPNYYRTILAALHSGVAVADVQPALATPG